MKLTQEQEAMLSGARGEALAKVMKTLVMYGEAFNAENMVPVTSGYGHLVTSFGLSVMKPVYALLDTLIDEGVKSKTPFSVDPRPLDANVPTNVLQKLLFSIMYKKQDDYEQQLQKLGLMNDKAFTCACYHSEVGNTPKKGDILSWAESSAVVYANSVLGARCNRNSGIFELFGLMAGYVPYFGLLTDEGRQASWIIELQCKKKPEAQILGSAIGLKVMEDVPYIVGLDAFLGTKLNDEACSYLKDMGAAAASNGAVGLYHVDGLTPEALEKGRRLVKKDARVYTITDEELERVKRSYPVIWKNPSAKPRLCFVGCPHLSLYQLHEWTEKLSSGFAASGKKTLAVPTVFTAAPAVLEAFAATPDNARLREMGVILSSICPLMYMNNPLCGKMPIITNSNKLRTYTSARYMDSDAVARFLTGGKL